MKGIVQQVQQIEKEWLEDVLIKQEDPVGSFYYILRVIEKFEKMDEEGRV